MSIQDKINNAQPSICLTEGMTEKEVRRIVKWAKLKVKIWRWWNRKKVKKNEKI